MLFTYKPDHTKTLDNGRVMLLAPGDPLPPPFVGIASPHREVRSPCRINGYGGTMFDPPPKSYEWQTILATLAKYGHKTAKCRDQMVARMLFESGLTPILV